MLSTAMFVYKNLCLEAVPPHFVYIIKFFAALQIAYSRSIPVRISDISLAENTKTATKNLGNRPELFISQNKQKV